MKHCQAFYGVPGSALVSPHPPHLASQSTVNKAVILKCRSIHKYFPAQTSNDFPNLQLPIVGCLLLLCCHMLWLSRQPQEPAVVPCTYQAYSYLIVFCLCCFFCLKFSSTRNVQGSFWPPLGLCFKSNIIFSRRSSMTNIFIKLYHPTSNSRTPYPNLCFVSLHRSYLTYYFTYLLVHCLSLCHIIHLE